MNEENIKVGEEVLIIDLHDIENKKIGKVIKIEHERGIIPVYYVLFNNKLMPYYKNKIIKIKH